MKVLFSNRKAYFNFDILDKVEAGISLYGWEVRSIKMGNANFANAFIHEKKGELYLLQSRIGLLKSAFEKDKTLETRERKLLLHSNQIQNLTTKTKMHGITAVPLDVYSNERGLIKLTIAVVKGKKRYEKKQKIKEQDLERSMEQDRKYYGI